MIWTHTGNKVFNATANITCNGVTMGGSIKINTAGITITLLDDFFLASFILHQQGTFEANDKNVTCFGISNNFSTNTRVLNMGSGLWTITATSGTGWSLATATGLTINASTSTIKHTNT